MHCGHTVVNPASRLQARILPPRLSVAALILRLIPYYLAFPPGPDLQFVRPLNLSRPCLPSLPPPPLLPPLQARNRAARPIKPAKQAREDRESGQ